MRGWRVAAALGAILLSVRLHGEQVALTFDDLPLNGELAPGTTRAGILTEVLSVLKQHGVPAVYGFINAQKLEGSQDGARALRLWVDGGQRVGNHGYSHMDLHKSAVDAYLADIRLNEPVLELLDATGSWHWYRYPYLREGETVGKRRAVRSALHERGYRIAQVTLDYEDYLWNSPYARCAGTHDEETIAWLRTSYLDTARSYIEGDRAMAQRVFGREIPHVLLLHLGAFSAAILPDLLELLQREGFTLATLEQVESDPAYASDPDAASKYGGTLLEQWMDARSLVYPAIPRKPYEKLKAACASP